ncbi:MAG: hypothetical protein ED859_14665 [Desulfuromonadales bacterium]|nr:MAG: hypothetical protein ED859_14665 [Desulfuromonadales bacterium]
MRGSEIKRMLTENVRSEHRFVRWWRKENDFFDYDLIDRFLEGVSSGEEIGGIELLTMDEMLEELRRVSGNRVTVVHGEAGDSVKWIHGGSGGERVDVCMYTPEALLTIYDAETRGNPVC